MKIFKKSNKSDSKKNSGGQGFGSPRGQAGSPRRDEGSPRSEAGGRGQMFDAICADCGQSCQVPFRPTGDKPVYCKSCFEKRGAGGQRRFERHDSRRPSFGGKRMFPAICDKCGKPCEVPFQPTAGKPIYCNQCFDRGGNAGAKGGSSWPKPGGGGDQLQSINAKLDKIINALIAANIIKTAPKETPAIPAAAKPAKEKKAVAKKPSGKKAKKTK